MRARSNEGGRRAARRINRERKKDRERDREREGGGGRKRKREITSQGKEFARGMDPY